jgi:hypothetical protein
MRCRTCRERGYAFMLRMITMKKYGELQRK